MPATFSQHIFSDEFDGSAVDTNRWDCSGGSPWYWPESARPELRSLYRTGTDNAIVSTGVLRLTTLKRDVNSDGQLDWSSGSISTRNVFEQRFGYFETRFKITSRPTQNNAFWIAVAGKGHNHATESWEIDIQQNTWPDHESSGWGHHVTGMGSMFNSKSNEHGIADMSAEYVTYGFEWATDHTLKTYLNGKLLHSFYDTFTLTGDNPITNQAAGYWGSSNSAFGVGLQAVKGASVIASEGRFASGTNGTVAFLFKTPPVISQYMSLFNQGDNSSSTPLEIGIDSVSQLRFSTRNGTSNQLNSVGKLTSNTWYYFAMRWDLTGVSSNLSWYYGPAGSSNLYSGTLDITSAGGAAKSIFFAGRLTSVPFTNGWIQHAAVYERTLSDAAIRSQFTAIPVSESAYAQTVSGPADGGSGPALWYRSSGTTNSGSAAGCPDFQRANSMRGVKTIFSTLPFLQLIDGFLDTGYWTTNDLEALHGTAMEIDWFQSFQKPGWIGQSGAWNQPDNWGPDGIPGAGVAAVFNRNTAQTNIVLTSDISVQELSFQSTNIPAMTVSGPGILKLGSFKSGSDVGIGGIGLSGGVIKSQTINASIEAQHKLIFVNQAGAPVVLDGFAEGLGTRLILNGPLSATTSGTPVDFFNLGDIVVNGEIDDRIGKVKKDAQGFLILNATNHFTGELEIRDGIVLVNVNGALGSTNGPTVVYPNTYDGSLVFGAVNYTQPEPVVIGGDGENNTGFERFSGALDVFGSNTVASFAGPVTLIANASIACNYAGSTLNLSGAISTGTNKLTFAGRGNINLNGPVSGNGSVEIKKTLTLGLTTNAVIQVTGSLNLSNAVIRLNPGAESFTGATARVLATAEAGITGIPSLATPLPSGYLLDATYSNGTQLVLRQTTAYDTWSTNWFSGIPNNPDCHPEADPDLDGASNLAEFAFGTNPQIAGRALTGAINSNLFRLLFLRRTDGTLTYVVRSSTNLIQGFPGTAAAQLAASQPAGLPAGYEQAEALVAPVVPQLFLKVDVQTP
jgi:hypothetical protein